MCIPNKLHCVLWQNSISDNCCKQSQFLSTWKNKTIIGPPPPSTSKKKIMGLWPRFLFISLYTHMETENSSIMQMREVGSIAKFDLHVFFWWRKPDDQWKGERTVSMQTELRFYDWLLYMSLFFVNHLLVCGSFVGLGFVGMWDDMFLSHD